LIPTAFTRTGPMNTDLTVTLRRNFARNLVKLREEHHLTQAGLAEALTEQYDIDLKRTSLANYESGTALPKLDALYCIAKYFGKSIDEIISDQAVPLTQRKTSQQPAATTLSPPAETVLKQFGSGQAIGTLDELLAAYVKSLGIHHFYVEFCREFVRQLQERINELTDPAIITHIFSKTFLKYLLSEDKIIQDKIRPVLTEREFEIFHSFQKGITLNVLSEALQISEEEVITMFNSAKNKVISAIHK
jgi:transcriptional regulator with XRE-family HTH domain